MTIETISGPIIGAIIGYCTNYIAVKMLFYPRKEIRVFGRKLPFTPGAIPKGKPRLAKAVAGIVSGTLLTEEDIRKKILSPELENAAVEKIMQGMSVDMGDMIKKLFPSEERYEDFQNHMTDFLTDQILESISNAGIGDIISTEGMRIVKEKTAGTMLAMFLNDELLATFVAPMGDEIENYICENGKSYIQPEVAARLNDLKEQSLMGLMEKMNVSEAKIRQMILNVYRTAVEKAAGELLKQLNITAIVEEKINEMSVLELEKMVLTVMKKELDIIVNLGAIIGAVLGTINVIF